MPSRAYAPAPQHDGAAPRQEGPQNELDAVLDLQQAYGNQAVVQLLAAGGHGSPPPIVPTGGLGNRAIAAIVAQRSGTGSAVIQRLPMDTNVGERVQHLRAAIRFEALWYRFVIDEGKAADALENMTEDEGKQVKARYQQLEKRNLGWILSAVETPIEDGPPASNNLSSASRTKLLNLLAGTRVTPPPAAEPAPVQGPAADAPVAGPAPAGPAAASPGASVPAPAPAMPAASKPAPPDPDKIRKRRQRVLAASIRRAIEKKDSETAISLIPASMDERREIDALYNSMYGKTAYMELFTKLPGRDGARAGALWYDEKDEADRYALEAGVEARDKAEKEAKAIESSPLGGMLGDAAKAKRQEGDRKLEAAVKKVGNAGDQTTIAGKKASRERLRELAKAVERGEGRALGPKNVGLNDDPVTKAIVEGDDAAEIGARLARADSIKDVSMAEIEAALREVRATAEDEANRQIDSAEEGQAVDAEATTKAMLDGYFARFREAFNKAQKRRTFLEMMGGHGGADEKLAEAVGIDVDAMRDAAGAKAAVDRNMALLNSKGQLDEVSELVFALRSKPKDLDRAREILSSKTYTEVDKLGKQYQARTNHTLEQDLAGTAIEQKAAKMFNETREDLQEKKALLVGGQWDRELAEKFAPSGDDPVAREAYFLKAEGDFWFRQAGQLESRVIENRGLFARARDWSGNDEKEILDTAREDRWKAMSALSKALAPGKAEGPAEPDDPGGSGPDLAGARKAVAELRVINRRMTHATSIYKESTKKAYEEFVDLVVNAATIAAGLGVTGIWLTALRTTAATVGTKFVMKGDDYSVDEFLTDVGGGMAGVAGDFAKLGMNKLVTPYVASKIMRLAGKLGMSKAFQAKVAAKLGPLAIRQADHTLGTAVSNELQGKSWKEGQGVGDRLKGEAQGALVKPIEEHIQNRRKAGFGDESDGIPRPVDAEEAGPAGRLTAGAPGAEPASGSSKAADDDPAPARPTEDADEAAAAPVAMALPEAPSPKPAGNASGGKGHSTAGSSPKPAPPTEPAAATPSGAKPRPHQMDAPRATGKSEPGAGGKRIDTGGARPDDAAPQAITGAHSGTSTRNGFEYPAGAQQLNADGGGVAPAAAPPMPSPGDLVPRQRSEALRKVAMAQLADAGRTIARVRDDGPESPMRQIAEAKLREAQDLFALAWGQRAPTAEELPRLIADERVADAQADYADVRGHPGSAKRVAAEERLAAARKEHATAREALRKAHDDVRRTQQVAEADSHLIVAAEAEFDKADAAFKSAQAKVKQAKADLSRAKAGLAPNDWRRRRAEIALHGAQRDRAIAYGEKPPPDRLGPMRKGQAEELQGPPEFEPKLWDRELVIQLHNKASMAEHQDLFFKMLEQDSTREIGWFRNRLTGEIIIVRGKEGVVSVESSSDVTGQGNEQGPRGKGEVQRWKELLDHGEDIGNWELVAHSHPSKPGQRVEPLDMYPSGFKGDFSVLVSNAKIDKVARESTIYYLDNGVRKLTTFGFDPYSTKPYWFQLPGQPKIGFPSLEMYQEHVTNEMRKHGVVPDFREVPADYPRYE